MPRGSGTREKSNVGSVRLFKTQRLHFPSLRRREAQYGDLAEATIHQGLTVGRHLVAQQRAALDAARNTLGFAVEDVTISSIEVQFLWGVYYELVADGPEFPTNGYDRILLHIINYLRARSRCHSRKRERLRLVFRIFSTKRTRCLMSSNKVGDVHIGTVVTDFSWMLFVRSTDQQKDKIGIRQSHAQE